MQKLLLALGFLFWGQTGTSQPVSFTLQSSLLNPAMPVSSIVECTVDMNGDFLDDVVRFTSTGFLIDYQQPNGIFTQQFFSMPFVTTPDWSICVGDIDNNGYNDILCGSSYAVSFLAASGDGSVYTEKVMAGSIFSQRSNFIDIDNDGWLDAFVCNDDGLSVPYRNDGEGNMSRDYDLINTANRPGNYAGLWTDYDNDGDIDMYLTKCQLGAQPGNINRTNLLYHNNGDGTFSEVGQQAGVDDNAQSWATAIDDFDNDGDFDAIVINHDFQNRLYRNNGDGTFTDVIAGSGIVAMAEDNIFEVVSGDFNNDGYLDIFSQLQKELYLGNGNLTFTGQDASVKPGAIADLNNDGFLDVVRNNQAWLNTPNSNHWIKVLPGGITSNKNGIGARVEIYGPWGVQVREVRAGQSYAPMSTLNVHFGLGQNDKVDSLIIRWPSGIVTTLPDLQADSSYFVQEKESVSSLTPEIADQGHLDGCMGECLTISPNPSDRLFFVEINGATGGATLCRLYDNTGNTIFRQAFGKAYSFQLDLGNLPAGPYYLQVCGDGFSELRGLFKN